MIHSLNHLFSLALFCVIAAIISWWLVIERLRVRHTSIYDALGRPSLSDGHLQSTIAVWKFLLSMGFLSLRDTILTVLSLMCLFFVAIIIILPVPVLIVFVSM
jgi:hypothetical protein